MQEKGADSTIKRISLNTFFDTLKSLFISGGAMVATIIIARNLGPAAYGKYAYILWIVGLAATVVGFGYPNALVRFTAEWLPRSGTKVVRLFSKTAALTCFFAAILVAAATIEAIGSGRDVFLILCAGIYLFLICITRLLSSVITGAQKYKDQAKISGLVTLSYLALLSALVWIDATVWSVFIALVAAEAIRSVALFRLFRRCVPAAGDQETLGRGDWTVVRNFSMSVYLLSLLDLIVWQKSEVFFVEMFHGVEMVAYYSISYGLAFMIMQVPANATNVLFPYFSELFGKNDRALLSKSVIYSIRGMAFVCSFIAGLAVVLSGEIIEILYGRAFSSSRGPFIILMAATAVATIHRPVSTYLYSSGKHSYILKVTAVLSVVNIISDLLLIPHYGTAGAAIANGGVQILGVVAGVWMLINSIETRYPFRFVAISLSGAVIAAALAVLAGWRLSGYPAGIVGVVVYLALHALICRSFSLWDENEIAVADRLAARMPNIIRPLTQFIRITYNIR